jgi:hypothetical protein
MLGLGEDRANTFRILTRLIVVAPTVRGVLDEENLTGVLRTCRRVTLHGNIMKEERDHE